MELINSLPEILAVLLAILGLIISLVGLPGVWLTAIGAFIWSWVNSFSIVTWPWLVVFFALAVASMFVDNLALIFGAKKYGASNWGILGCVFGIIVGTIVGGFVGTILGAFLGAVAFEMLLANKESSQAFQAGVGTMLGFFVGLFLKFLMSLFILISWWNIVL